MQPLTEDQCARVEKLARETGRPAKAAAARGCAAKGRRATPTIMG